jgi:hypothetical protein
MTNKHFFRLSQPQGSPNELSLFRFPIDESVIVKSTGEKASVLDAVFDGDLFSAGRRAPVYTVLTESGRRVDVLIYELRRFS